MQEKVKPRKDSRTQLYVIPIYKLCGRHELLYSSVYGQLYRGDDVHARLEKWETDRKITGLDVYQPIDLWPVKSTRDKFYSTHAEWKN